MEGVEHDQRLRETLQLQVGSRGRHRRAGGEGGGTLALLGRAWGLSQPEGAGPHLILCPHQDGGSGPKRVPGAGTPWQVRSAQPLSRAQAHGLHGPSAGPEPTVCTAPQRGNPLQPRGLQHTRIPCLSPTPRDCSNSFPSNG